MNPHDFNVRFSNQSAGVLRYSIDATSTTLELVAGEGVRFPGVDDDQYFYLSLVPRGHFASAEIVKVTRISGDTFTIERGQDGTSPLEHPAGTSCELRLVSAALYDLALEVIQEAKQERDNLHAIIEHTRTAAVAAVREEMERERGRLITEAKDAAIQTAVDLRRSHWQTAFNEETLELLNEPAPIVSSADVISDESLNRHARFFETKLKTIANRLALTF